MLLSLWIHNGLLFRYNGLLKGLAQAKIIKKSVILFRAPNMTDVNSLLICYSSLLVRYNGLVFCYNGYNWLKGLAQAKIIYLA